MALPAKQQIVDWILDAYEKNPRSIEHPWIYHAVNTGLLMEAVAKETASLDPALAKVMGVLHDVGKRELCSNPDFNGMKRAHDIIGYEFLNEKGFPELAAGSLTYSLLCTNPDRDFNIRQP